METSDLNFELPAHLIATKPSPKRGEDRMLVVNRQQASLSHSFFSQLPQWLPKGALLVFNDSKVRKGRIFAHNKAGSLVEFLLIEQKGSDEWLCMVNKAKRQQVGQEYEVEGGAQAKIIANLNDGLKQVHFKGLDENYLEQFGHVPLPPYLKRPDSAMDSERYQTIYASSVGSSAAPTAGLHFTPAMLNKLTAAGFEQAFITLHVGLGTFMPIRGSKLDQHTMHSESYSISTSTAQQINKAITTNRPIIAIGTTSLRTLESAVQDNGLVQAGSATTNIFIYGNYCFKVVKGLFTNFHTPESTLLALVRSFAGDSLMKQAYAEAIKNNYKFFSYGDCNLIVDLTP
jgi:S-adenosylmethionine:tRNA ribosyltransferase-isomerase